MFSFLVLICVQMIHAQLQRQSTVNASSPTANSVTIYHDSLSAIISGSSYNISVASQNAYDLLVSLQSKWAFKATVESTLAVIIDGATPNPVSDTDFLIVFVVGNTQFFSFFTQLDTNIIADKVYPLKTIGTKASFSAWMHDESVYSERWDRVSDGGGENWQNTNPRHKAQSEWPLRFELINDPIADLCTFKFYNQGIDYVAANVFNGSFNPLQTMDIYIMGDTTGEQFQVRSIEIEQYHTDGVPTTEPTLSPVLIPTNTPSDNPTNIPSVSPVINPSISPTNVPSVSPTNVPTISPIDIPSVSPTIVPTNNPSNNPSVFPTISPTGVPSSTPSLTPTINPSSVPSISPIPSSVSTQAPNPTTTETTTFSPSDNPSSNPTESPITTTTNAPSTYPTAIPSETPSANPNTAPSVPSYTPSIAPSYMYIIHQPTTEIPSILPTTDPTTPIYDTEGKQQPNTSVYTTAFEDKLANTKRPTFAFETTSYIIIMIILISICFIGVLILLVVLKKNQNKNNINQRKAADVLAMNQMHEHHPHAKKLKPYHHVESHTNVAMVHAPVNTRDSQSKSSTKISSSDINMDEVEDEIRDLKLTREHGTFGKDSAENESEDEWRSQRDEAEEEEDDDETSGPVVRFLDAVQDGINYEETETKHEEMTDTKYDDEFEDVEDTVTDDGFKDRTMPMPFKKNTSGGSYDAVGINPAAFLSGNNIRHGSAHAHAIDSGFIINAPPPTNTTITHSATAMSHQQINDEEVDDEEDRRSSSDDSYHDRMAAYNFVENQQILNAHDMAIKNVNKDVNIGPMMMMLDIMKTTQSPRSTTSKEHLSLMVENGDSLEDKPFTIKKSFTDTL